MHPLDGPRIKVERAKSQLVTLQATFQEFFKQYPPSIGLDKFDKRAGHYPIRILSAPTKLPDVWGVFIGEVAHNLRSALDHLAWQLALLNKAHPYSRTMFPIYSIGHTKDTSKPHFWGKGHGRRLLQSIAMRYWKRIEAFQPYKRRNGGRRSPLFLLNELNNTDKHRLITFLAAVAGGMRFTGIAGGGSHFKIGSPLYINAKVGYVRPLPADGVLVADDPPFSVNGKLRTRIQTEVLVNLDITPGIKFGEGCDTVKGLPVLPTLHRITDKVSRIIESFAGEFQ